MTEDTFLRGLMFVLGLVWLVMPVWATWDMWRHPELRFEERYLSVFLFYALGIGILVRSQV